jgi:CRISPR-associated endonuclease Csn1
MKRILGLDLGTNSIGWALVDTDVQRILGLGSRIIPMTQDVLDLFSGGKPLQTQTAARTNYRGIRRIRERHLLRRERLHRILNVLGFLPEHYARDIDFEKHYGQFVDESEPKLAYDNKTFIFKSSFNEMLAEFKQTQPPLFYTKANGKETLIPYDWTIYYLRKKALSQKIAKEELAWIILNFNQKRGYYQLRGEEDEAENPTKLVEYHSLKIIDVVADEKPNTKGEIWYSLYLENGWIYRRQSKTALYDWKDKVRDFIVTTELNDDGSIKEDKEGNVRRSFRAPGEDDWTLLKKKTEQEIIKSEKTVGSYIYESILQNPTQKIRGKLVRTIERSFYKEELKAILKKQIELQPELFSTAAYNDCVRELYRNNIAHQLTLSSRNDFIHLLIEDIIFYQRPLRSQKSTIGNCSFEFHEYKINKLDENGNKLKDESGNFIFEKDSNGDILKKKEYLKVIPKSHPLYQEFRVWQWLANLKIYRKDDDTDVTPIFLKSNDEYVKLFELLMTLKEVGHKDILKHLLVPILHEKYPGAKASVFNKEVEKEIAKYRWNYVYDESREKEEDKSKKYPCNSTGYEIRKRLEKVDNIPADFLTTEKLQHLWHIIYSVTDKNDYKSALDKFAKKHNIDAESFTAAFEKFPPFQSEFGAYSFKAINKFLSLMRMGKFWDWDAIDSNTKDRIEKIISGEYDEKIKDSVREKSISLTHQNSFQGLPAWLVSYIIYDKQSVEKWNTIDDLTEYLENFKQHSLRNPIVEQVITETLRVVRDIWKQYGHGAKNYFDEIHVELGREMKNTAEDRKRLSDQISINEATNLRIKALLNELKENSDGKLTVENVRPFSATQQDALKIYEEGVLRGNIEVPEDIVKISKSSQPSKSELQRYKLWLEQKYRSPYTGQIIPLARLFTEDYQIEHVIPKSRYFDDSFNNKVICEAAVNQLKDKQLGFEFIKNHPGERVECGMGKVVEIFTEEAYQTFVKEHYSRNQAKRQNLLLEDIPEKMIARQMNDTRYISKYISSILSNIVRSENNDDEINSKNLIPGNGKITSILKKDWGMDAVWNELILPRFERMNTLTNTNAFTYWNEQHQKFLPVDYSPVDSKRIEKKRIDHRHHAMDALVIACMTRDHVNLLNNQSAKSETTRYDLQNKLRNKSRVTWTDKKTGKQVERDVFKEFKKPWDHFTIDAKNALDTVVVSFKQNLRVINKATNNYQKWVPKNGIMVKQTLQQEGTNWAIRKPMHKETVAGIVNIRQIKSVSLAMAIDKWEMIVDKKLKIKIKQMINESHDIKKITKFFSEHEYQWDGKDVKKIDIYCFSNDTEVLVASRVNLDSSFNTKKIETVTDSGIRKILIEHLSHYNQNADLAFSPEGIEDMNKRLTILNKGRFHLPIKKVRTFEPKGNKFNVGIIGNKKNKFVVAATGTNLYFSIFTNKDGKRFFETIPLNVVIERLKQGDKPIQDTKTDENGNVYILYDFLNPNDIVYIPTEDQKMNINITIDELDKNRIYRFIDSSDTTANFIPVYTASLIFNFNKKDQEKIGTVFPIQNEYGIGSPQSKNQRAVTGEMIKDVCIKLKIDRLGNITF